MIKGKISKIPRRKKNLSFAYSHKKISVTTLKITAFILLLIVQIIICLLLIMILLLILKIILPLLVNQNYHYPRHLLPRDQRLSFTAGVYPAEPEEANGPGDGEGDDEK